MGNILRYDNKGMALISKAVDSFILGLLWLICSLPVLTIGASSAAFYYAFNKSIRQNIGYPWKEFLHGFRINFKQATILWGILAALGLVLSLDIYILTGDYLEIGIFKPALLVAAVMVGVMAVMWGLCGFAYLSRFENTLKLTLRNSLLVTFSSIFWSLLLLVLFVSAVILFFSVPILSLFVPAVYMLGANRILERVFRQYMGPDDLAAQKEE